MRVGILCLFFFVVFAIAFLFSGDTATTIIAGEDSVGSWMSGVLLIISAAVSANAASVRKPYPWLLFTIFFALLAVDENFMIHEGLKRWIVFSRFEATGEAVYWIGELPVIAGAFVGALVAFVMWRHVDQKARWLIALGVIFGLISVTMDVVAYGVVWEDSCKLIGELAVTSALVWDVQKQ